jgi:sucrose-6-phosphate hydrolase SacC (GH32 family)
MRRVSVIAILVAAAWYTGVVPSGPAARAADRADIVFADFESPTYGDWKAEGTAFGEGPAEGTLPNQMPVTGYQGRRLVNSFRGGDAATGTLTSPPFKIEHLFISFLIGGGGFEGKTCMNLLIEGRVARTATGPNTEPGGTEELGPASWDVSDLAGKTARIQIVDQATGGWGHINVDQIVFTDTILTVQHFLMHVRRELSAQRRLLCFPVKNGAPFRKVKVSVMGEVVREFPIEAADKEPDWWASFDISEWHGKPLTIEVDRLAKDSRFLSSIEQSDAPKGQENLYREPLRQQFHFSATRGWINDPNGLCFYDGEYHLFFQWCPYTTRDSDKHWGHAVSTDLVHWKELGVALYPDTFGPMWSGSAVVDWKNTSGFGADGKPPLVLAYTAAGAFVQCIASSTDGRSFTKYTNNPVAKNISDGNRDPKIIWYEPTKQWVMALYVGFPPASDKINQSKGERHTIQFLTSPDLKTWTRTGEVEGFYECPDLFPLPVDGNPADVKWVLTAADSDYMVGRFDGRTFTPETPKLKGQRGRGFYAAQTFSDVPASDGRRIQIGWLQVPAPGMPFNQAMSVPLELKLLSTPDGPRLARTPVKELELLRADSGRKGRAFPSAGKQPVDPKGEQLYEVRVDFGPLPKQDGAIPQNDVEELSVRGITLRYDIARQELTVTDGKTLHLTSPAPLRGGRQRLTVLADRGCFEIFASDGLVYIPIASASIDPNQDGTPRLSGSGPCMLYLYDAVRLNSMWAPGPAAPENSPQTQPTTRPIEQSADGTLRLHARDVTVHGTVVRYEPDPHKNTVGYWTKKEDWVSWDFAVSSGGTFEVLPLQGCGKGSGGADVEFTFDDKPPLKMTVQDTGGFQNFVERHIGTIELSAGQHTLSVKPLTKPGQAVMDLRQVMLKPSR